MKYIFYVSMTSRNYYFNCICIDAGKSNILVFLNTIIWYKKGKDNLLYSPYQEHKTQKPEKGILMNLKLKKQDAMKEKLQVFITEKT